VRGDHRRRSRGGGLSDDEHSRVLCPLRGGAAPPRSGLRHQPWCDPCRRAGPDPRRELPAGFYVQDPVATALAHYDFATVFRRIRMATGWSQQTLAEEVGLEQTRISAIERGIRPLRDVALVAQVATRLGIPAIQLGFGTTVNTAGGDEQRLVSWVDRRDFVQYAAALVLSVPGAAALDVDRLIALLPSAEPSSTRHIGLADVEAIEQATTEFARQDFAQGSGMARSTAAARLHATLPLLNAQMTDEVRPRLRLATAHLAMMAGWMSFDVTQHDAARRLWLIGLDIARHTEDSRSSDLAVYLLYDMALQAVHLNRPDEALRLVHLGHAAAANARLMSASTIGCLGSIQARAHAAQGDTADCDRALSKVIEQVSIIDPASSPPWGAHFAEAGTSRFHGSAYYTLALASRDSNAAQRAVPLLRQAVDSFGPGYARLRAQYLPDLSGAHALAGDTDTAVSIGHQAIDAVTALHSPRVYDRLRVLHTALEPLHISPGVAELRDRLTTIAA
jgi:transcriptional regulator with XRE-family HTH domain